MRKTITQIAAKPKSKNSTQEAQKKRVAAYTRVSTEQDEQLNSLLLKKRVAFVFLVGEYGVDRVFRPFAGFA